MLGADAAGLEKEHPSAVAKGSEAIRKVITPNNKTPNSGQKLPDSMGSMLGFGSSILSRTPKRDSPCEFPPQQPSTESSRNSTEIEDFMRRMMGGFEPSGKQVASAKNFFTKEADSESETGSLDDILVSRGESEPPERDRVMIPKFSDLFRNENSNLATTPKPGSEAVETKPEIDELDTANLYDSSEQDDEDEISIIGSSKPQPKRDSLTNSRYEDQVECLESVSSRPYLSKRIDLTNPAGFRSGYTPSSQSRSLSRVLRHPPRLSTSPTEEIEAYGGTSNQETSVIHCGCTSTLVPCQSQKCQCAKAGLTCSIDCKCGPMCKIPGEDKKLRQLKDIVPFLRQRLIETIKQCSGDGYLRDSDLVLERALHGVRNPESRIAIEKEFRRLDGIKKSIVAKEIQASQEAIERRKKAQEWLERLQNCSDSDSEEEDISGSIGEENTRSENNQSLQGFGEVFRISSEAIDEPLVDANPRIKIPEGPPEGFAMRTQATLANSIAIDHSEESQLSLNPKRSRGRPRLNFTLEKPADFEQLAPSQQRKYLADMHIHQSEPNHEIIHQDSEARSVGFVTHIPQMNEVYYTKDKFGFGYQETAHYPQYQQVYSNKPIESYKFDLGQNEAANDDFPWFELTGSAHQDSASTPQSTQTEAQEPRLQSALSSQLISGFTSTPSRPDSRQPVNIHTEQTFSQSQIEDGDAVSKDCTKTTNAHTIGAIFEEPAPLAQIRSPDAPYGNGVLVVSGSNERVSTADLGFASPITPSLHRNAPDGPNARPLLWKPRPEVIEVQARRPSVKVIEVENSARSFLANNSFGAGQISRSKNLRIQAPQVVEISSRNFKPPNNKNKPPEVVNLTRASTMSVWSSSSRTPSIIDVGSQTVVSVSGSQTVVSVSGSQIIAQQLKKFTSQKAAN